jgi:hypothetical protein
VGGLGLGFIEKQFPDIPTIPLVGKKGTIAIAAYFAAKNGLPFARDIGMVAAGLAGYELGRDGQISGDVVPQVRGIASQV